MDRISVGHPEYDSLMSIWISERKPGWINHGNRMYRVLQDTDGEPFFLLDSGGIDGNYSSRSTEGISQ